MDDYDTIASYWDLIAPSQTDYAADAARVADFFKLAAVRKVLDVSCGTGSHLLELARRGYDCTGFDRSAEMVRCARRKAEREGIPAVFERRRARDIDGSTSFDSALCLYTLPGLSDAEIVAMLTGMARAVRPGGLVVLNVPNAASAPAVGAPHTYVDLAVVEGQTSLLRLNHVAQGDRAQDWTAIYFIQENDKLTMTIHKNPLRSFTIDQIGDFLGDAGMRVIQVDYVTVGDFDDWEMFVCAKKMRSTARQAARFPAP